MKRLTRLTVFLFLLPFLMVATEKKAFADGIIFSDFGPGKSSDTTLGWSVFYAQTPAMGFVSSGNYSVTQLDLAMFSLSGPGNVAVELTTDSAGVPGEVLESWNTILPLGQSILSITGITGVDISAGNYFLVAAPCVDTTNAGWNLNSAGVTGLGAFSHNGGQTWDSFPGQKLGAFDILGNPVSTPEPSTFLLLVTGLAVVIYGLRGRIA